MVPQTGILSSNFLKKDYIRIRSTDTFESIYKHLSIACDDGIYPMFAKMCSDWIVRNYN